MIHLEKSLSDESENSTFHENIFNGARHLTCQRLWQFQFQYERMSKPCMTNAMCSLYIMTCSLFDFLKAGLHFPKVGWIWKTLLWVLSFQHCLLILGFSSVCGILKLSGVRSKANWALSFLLTPIWLGIQHIIISLQFDIESSLLNSFRGFSSLLLLNDCKTES